MSHTKELLSVIERGDYGFGPEADLSCEKDDSQRGYLSLDDARRIVACWNAFANVPDSELIYGFPQIGKVSIVHSSFVDRFENVTQQRDELLAENNELKKSREFDSARAGVLARLVNAAYPENKDVQLECIGTILGSVRLATEGIIKQRDDIKAQLKQVEALSEARLLQIAELEKQLSEANERTIYQIRCRGEALSELDRIKNKHDKLQGELIRNKRQVATGKAIDRACQELPEGFDLLIELEKDAGTVRLYKPDGEEDDTEFHYSDSFAESIDNAIDTAVAIMNGSSTSNDQPETSVPAIVFYPAGSLGEEVES